MPICPFIAGDLQTGNIKFMVYNSNMDKSLIEMIQEWKESDFKTGLILHIGDGCFAAAAAPSSCCLIFCRRVVVGSNSR